MTIEDAAKEIATLHAVLLFEVVAHSGVSELTQQDICQSIDFLSLAHHSMVKAQFNHAREIAEHGMTGL